MRKTDQSVNHSLVIFLGGQNLEVRGRGGVKGKGVEEVQKASFNIQMRSRGRIIIKFIEINFAPFGCKNAYTKALYVLRSQTHIFLDLCSAVS